MPFHKSTLASLLQGYFNYLESQGYDAAEFFRRAELDASRIYDADARFPVFNINRLWQIALQETGNPCLLYEVVHHFEPTMLHAMGHAWIVSRTLLEALQRFVRCHRMLSTNVDIKLERAQGSWQLVGHLIYAADENVTDGVLALSLHMCRKSYGEDLVPLHVQLTRSKPEDCTPIDDFFRCEVDYKCTDNVIVFNSADLTRRLKGANVAVAVAMEDVITSYLARVDASDIVNQVRKFIATFLIHGEPTKQDIAEELHLTTRTLQRRLEDQGSSVKSIIDETRHQLALEFLDQDHHSIKEVAFNLGFSDPSNFSRAFKRWENLTPKQYRHEKEMQA